ncbi:MAG TPA: acetyl-CoA C-acetyltransferase [Vicinamibacterales bacterium]|nr:acetyl-CoA C-acetyltransferase [Vicinamibacterales bacterium]
MARDAYIIDAIRTPIGKKNGGLAQVHPIDLAAHVLRALLTRNDIDPAAIDDVILGCLDTIGPQAGDIARLAALAAGLPESVPGVTVDRQCGSSQQAIDFAAMGVMSGVQDLVIAGGVQSMNMVPIGAAVAIARPHGLPEPTAAAGWIARYGTQEISQYRGAELVAEHWNISREEMENYALRSNLRAIAAVDGGVFDAEIVPWQEVRRDEALRRGTTLEKMAALPPLRPGGRITAALSSQIGDGSAAVLIASENAVRRFRLKPRARIHHMGVVGEDPVRMLSAPIPATRRALQKTGLRLLDIDRIEINEAFASVVLAWQRELDADLSKVNVHGGAIALGHALGATGARLMTTLLYELERCGGRWGLQTMCEAGGQANVTIIERL